MADKKQRNIKIVIIILVVLLALSLTALAGTLIYNKLAADTDTTASVSDNIITPDDNQDNNESEKSQSTGSATSPTKDTSAAEIMLYKKHLQDNTLFSFHNMFPGDSETKYYRVKVSYHDTITVHFKAETRDGQENAAEVMGVKVKLITSGETLYEGLMQDMPQSITYTMTSGESTTDEIYYEITAYLDTSAGNEYQNKEVILDFHWWADESDNLDKAPQTGDTFNAVLLITAALTSAALCIVLLVFRRKKEDGQNDR